MGKDTPLRKPERSDAQNPSDAPLRATPLTFSDPRYERGTLRQLLVDGKNVIGPWGVEFADSSSFYSLEEGVGYRYEVETHHEVIERSSRTVQQVLRLREGRVRLELAERLETPTTFVRTCTLECLEDTILMDFVLRFQFSASEFPVGFIAGHTLRWEAHTRYHQYPVNGASVGNDRYTLEVAARTADAPESMQAMAYLRGGEDVWVLHLRMLPVRWEKEVVKLCSRWFGTRPLPQWIANTLLAIPSIKHSLWYRGERRPWRNPIIRFFSPNAFPMALMEKGQRLRWTSTCNIHPPRDSGGPSESLT